MRRVSSVVLHSHFCFCVGAVVFVSTFFIPASLGQMSIPAGKTSAVLKQLPPPSFVLTDGEKPQPSKVVMGPMHSDGKGHTSGSFAVYGGSSLVQVSSLAMDAEGKLLAVGSTPNRVDLWDVENRKLLRSFTGGTMVAISSDGKTLVSDGNGLEIWDVASGKLQNRINRNGDFIRQLVLDPSGALLLVSVNGEDDSVFDVRTGQKLAMLKNTQWGQFSRDASVVIGGNSKQLIVWDTKTWQVIRTLPNGPDYVTRIAAYPEKNLVVVGGPKTARLVRFDSGETVATVGEGYTNFASFNSDGTLIMTYPSSGFFIWDSSGKPLCTTTDIGNGQVALSANNKWLASGPVGGREVMVWDVSQVLQACGIRP